MRGTEKISRTTLGLVAAGKRSIKPGDEFAPLFPKPSGRETIYNPDGTVYDTVKLMDQIARENTGDTLLIAPKFKRDSLQKTCKEIFDWCYTHMQYELDKPRVEQLRTPARAWHDRKEGIDCDCFSIFISSILLNLGISHKFRVTKYDDDWQHVYVIVPDRSSPRGYLIIDCVLDTYDYEKSFTDKFDHNMPAPGLNGLPICILSGLPGENESSELMKVVTGSDFSPVSGIGNAQQQLDAIYNHLVRTRDFIAANPSSVVHAGGAPANLAMLDIAIKNWNTPDRDAALVHLVDQEEKWNRVAGLKNSTETVSGLGQLGGLKKFFSKVKDAVEDIKNDVKDVGQNIIAYNPLTLAMRGGFLLAFRVNLFGMAHQLGPAVGYNTRGRSSAEMDNSRRRYEHVRKIFVDRLKGTEETLKKMITHGAAKKGLDGLGCPDAMGALGEPVEITAAVAAAVPILEAYNAIYDGAHTLGDTTTDPAKTEEKDLELTNPSPETNQAAAAGLGKFIGAIKNWFAKRKARGHGQNDEQLAKDANDAGTQTTDPKDLPTPKIGDHRAGENSYTPAAPTAPATPPATPPATTPAPAKNESGILQMGVRWAKDNPGTAFALVAVTGFGITMLFKKPREAIFGSGHKAILKPRNEAGHSHQGAHRETSPAHNAKPAGLRGANKHNKKDSHKSKSSTRKHILT